MLRYLNVIGLTWIYSEKGDVFSQYLLYVGE